MHCMTWQRFKVLAIGQSKGTGAFISALLVLLAIGAVLGLILKGLQ